MKVWQAFLFALGAAIVSAAITAHSQESHAWLIWSNPLGAYHQVSKVQVEDNKCFLMFEGWTGTTNKTGIGLTLAVEPWPCGTVGPR